MVERQKEANRNYAKNSGLTIVEEFGGRYGSAKSDFTRKELTRGHVPIKMSLSLFRVPIFRKNIE